MSDGAVSFVGVDAFDTAAADASFIAEAARADEDGVADADAVVDEKLVTFSDIVEVRSPSERVSGARAHSLTFSATPPPDQRRTGAGVRGL